MFIFLYDNLNIIFASKFLGTNSISAIGVGAIFINASGLILGIGLIGAVDILCAQAYGAKSYYLMGIYVNTSRIVMIGFFIFSCLPCIMSCKYILTLIEQPLEIRELVCDYVKSMIPAVFLALQFYVNSHYLQSMNIFYPTMMVTLITAALHPIWLYFFLEIIGCDIRGVGYAMGVTHLLNFVIMKVYLDSNNPNPESYFYFDTNSISIRRIYDYLKLAVPSGIIFSSDWLGFQILILYSSYMDLSSLTVNVCIFHFYTLLYSIPVGISLAVCIYVGQMMGSNRVYAAKVYSFIGFIIGLLLVIIVWCIVVLFKKEIAEIYSDDENVNKVFVSIIPLIICFAVFDASQLIMNGVLKGLGKVKQVSLLTLTVLYPVNIPVSLTMGFKLNYKLTGLWYAQLGAAIFLNFAYVVMIICLDWENNALRTIVNISLVTQKIKRKTMKLVRVIKNKDLLEKLT